jgi:hypothetical protein
VSVCWLESKEQRDRGKSVVMRWLIVDHGRAPHQVFLASVFPYRSQANRNVLSYGKFFCPVFWPSTRPISKIQNGHLIDTPLSYKMSELDFGLNGLGTPDNWTKKFGLAKMLDLLSILYTIRDRIDIYGGKGFFANENALGVHRW